MFIIYDENMNEKKLPNGVTPLDIEISSIDKERATSNIEGSNGKVDYGYTFNEREITLRMMLRHRDAGDYFLLKDEIYNLFQLNDKIFITELHQRGKRYLVTIDDRYEPDNITRTSAIVELSCTTVKLPFAESIGTTQDIERDGISANEELWGFGMGLIADNESLKYTHTGTLFKIFNAGNVPIHPFEQELKITISDVVGSSDYLELENTTNGTIFRVNEGVSSSQEIVIDGANITSNGLQYLRQTNKQFIELDVGWNDFRINGATDAKVSFDFRFYYL